MLWKTMKDHEGNALEEKVPRQDVLARGVKKFDLYYGFFFDEDWMEAEDWHSNEKRYRNPTEELDEEEPDYVQRLREQQMKPVDGLPAFVKVVLEIEDEKQPRSDKGKKPPKKKGKTQMFSSIIRVPLAQENYLPSLQEDEEDED